MDSVWLPRKLKKQASAFYLGWRWDSYIIKWWLVHLTGSFSGTGRMAKVFSGQKEQVVFIAPSFLQRPQAVWEPVQLFHFQLPSYLLHAFISQAPSFLSHLPFMTSALPPLLWKLSQRLKDVFNTQISFFRQPQNPLTWAGHVDNPPLETELPALHAGQPGSASKCSAMGMVDGMCEKQLLHTLKKWKKQTNFFTFNLKTEQQRKKENLLSIYELTPHHQMPIMHRAGSGWSQQPGTPSMCPMEVMKAQALAPSIFNYLPSCISRELDRKWNSQDWCS